MLGHRRVKVRCMMWMTLLVALLGGGNFAAALFSLDVEPWRLVPNAPTVPRVWCAVRVWQIETSPQLPHTEITKGKSCA